ncbi:hypothetical protein scyTo_0007627 [Scyliorhinus torazame]|uniref:Uncharacterized protein n=1 Tax=Scyliorhinus torazame TaxID=75743 RepID=A0A401NVW7_SCYTO|nr:hypothetical protein [Scyliorhinus torazame]
MGAAAGVVNQAGKKQLLRSGYFTTPGLHHTTIFNARSTALKISMHHDRWDSGSQFPGCDYRSQFYNRKAEARFLTRGGKI